MIHAFSLSEAINFAIENAGKSTLFISQSESYPAGLTLGDEDSTAGSTLKMKVQLFLETPADSLYFMEEYEDEEMYKEVVGKLEGLKQTVTTETIEASELEAKVKRQG